MKNILLLVALIFSFISVQSQEQNAKPAKTGDKFFFGISYTYLNADMKLMSMTKHSVWDDQDLGTKDLSREEIDTINSYMKYSEKFNNINLSAGMIFLNKPGGHWYIDGRLLVGYAYRINTLVNLESDSAGNKIKSQQNSISCGLDFNFKYIFNDHWALHLGLNSIYATGRDNNIDENIYPVINFLNESRENIYRLLYSTVCLMASYRYKDFTFEAGPGVYFLFNGNTYHIERTSGDTGATYVDEIKTRLKSDKFINGLIQVGWRISGHFQVGAGVGIGSDFSANAGAVYFL